ncbi:MAG: hypothetical protein IKX47_06305 [Oscillospiraceae bacterium]|nr:hypothetical protein [Oscillospiraceae bacterium]
MKKVLLFFALFVFLFSACAPGGGGGTPASSVPASPEPEAPAHRLSEDGRIILTVGAFQQGENQDELYSYALLEKAVDRFNRKNKEYLVEIRNYGDSASAEARAKLDGEILDGDIPDMLMTYGMPAASYGKKGLLLDLYDWYDREQFFSGPLKSMETDGRLYSVSSAVQIISFFGLESVLGKAEGYSLEDIYGAWKCFYTGENTFLPRSYGEFTFLYLAGLRMREWVDLGSASCRFDSPEFLSLLKFCQKLPGEATVTQSEAYAQGKLSAEQIDALCVKNHDALLGMLFIQGGVGSILGEYASYLTPLEGEDIVYAGVPGTVPAAAGCVSELPMAVSARCGEPEGARQFLDSLWDLKYRQVYENEMRSIPLMRSVLEDYIRFYREHSARTYTDENGEAYTALYIAETITPLRDADIDVFLNQIENASVPVPNSFSMKVDPIVMEEALAFFSGAQSAEQTAKNIQTRYGVYLAEQK